MTATQMDALAFELLSMLDGLTTGASPARRRFLATAAFVRTLCGLLTQGTRTMFVGIDGW